MRMKMQEKADKKPNKLLYMMGLLAVLLALGICGIHVRAALESDKAAGTRSVHMQDSQIEPATLVIGSHLIHINGLTDELYTAAMESANEFNQHQMYYKSELAEGAWFEISEAVSIADIATSGNPVNKSVIEALEFTHMTNANGITTDLRNGQNVSVFDINDPYDLNALEELEPLRIQYQILQEKTDKNESDEIYLKMIQEFFGKDIRTDRTRECDASLKGLEAYKGALPSREKPSMWVEKTEKVMTSVDAERRVLSLNVLADYLDDLENSASGMGASLHKEETEEGEGEGEEAEEEEIPDFFINSEIVAAVGDCIQNVEESISAYEAKRMTDSGETISARVEYQYSQELIVKAGANDTPGCDEIMEMLCNLQNILDGVIADQDSELSALTSELVQAAFQKYAQDLRAGVSQEYQNAQADGASQAALSGYLTEQKAAANADRLEYQTMLEAQFERMENEQAQQYTLQLIDGVPQLERSIQQDAAESYLRETVGEYLIWLRNEYAQQVKNSSDGTEMSKLEEEKDALAKQRQDALDQNDLAKAKRLTAEMEAKQKEIDDLLKRLNDILNSPNSSEADKAKARAGMGNSSVAAQLSQMADQLSADILSADGNSDDLKNQLAALTAAAQLDPEAGANALSQVQGALNDATGLDAGDKAELEGTVSDALENVAKLQSAAKLDSEDAFLTLLNDILSQLLGTSYEGASDSQQSAAILALEWYGQNKKNDFARSLAATLTRQKAKAGSAYLYQQYQDQKNAYLSLQALGKALGYRYIFDDRHNTVTLQKSKEYYLFTLGKKQCTMAGGGGRALNAAPALMDTLYILGTDSQTIFDVKAEYIEKTTYGIVGTSQVETLAKEIYDKLLEGGA